MPTIEITANDARIQYTASAGQTAFVYDFIIFANTDITVVQNGTILTLTTDYTVSGVGNASGGTVTLTTGATLNDTITIFRDTSIARASQYQVDGRFDAGPLERDLDRIFTILQEQERNITRAVTLNTESALSSIELPTASSEKFIRWNTAANALENSAIDEGDIVNAASNAAAAAASASAASTSASNAAASAAAAAATAASVDFTLADNNTFTGDNTFQGIVDVTNINAETSAGGALRTASGANCLTWGAGGSANSTLGGNMSGASTHKLVNMADPTAAQDYATKAYVDGEIGSLTSGGLVLLGSYTASNATSVDIGSGLDLDAAIDGTYDEYFLRCINIVPATDNAHLYLRTSTDAGVSFDSGASDYGYSSLELEETITTFSVFKSTAASQLVPHWEIGNAAGESANVDIRIFSPSNSSLNTLFLWEGVSVHASNGNSHKFLGGGQRRSAADVDALRVLMSTGNITSGTFYLYGIRKS